MSTRPDPAEPDEGPALEPIRVLRPRRTDALAELFKEWEQDQAGYETVAVPVALPGAEDATQELPAVAEDTAGARRRGRPGPAGPGFRRTAVAVAVTAAAVIGFGGALLLPGHDDDATAGEPAPSETASAAEPDPTAPAAPGEGEAGDPACTASFRTVNSWQGGFQGEVTVTNAPAASASGWTATVVPPDGARLTQVWDGTLATARDGRATVTNASWNGALAPGASVTFGFLADTSDASGQPSATVTCAATAGAS
ncbi:cellulose binding domain-containing protein [Streptomyces ferrugineus]|uniref:cellulose binding domain-containing protein n=1 Tax=Streptomyces ferrugineus TaxID=1413221 RepID=UPI002AD3FA69|nr:cellulose binding domain-containing protein [Streptomyces ferrugineus]